MHGPINTRIFYVRCLRSAYYSKKFAILAQKETIYCDMNVSLIVIVSLVTKERMKPNTSFVQKALIVFSIQHRQPKRR